MGLVFWVISEGTQKLLLAFAQGSLLRVQRISLNLPHKGNTQSLELPSRLQKFFFILKLEKHFSPQINKSQRTTNHPSRKGRIQMKWGNIFLAETRLVIIQQRQVPNLQVFYFSSHGARGNLFNHTPPPSCSWLFFKTLQDLVLTFLRYYLLSPLFTLL